MKTYCIVLKSIAHFLYIDTMDTRDAFNEFYDAVIGLINYYYRERTITVTS